MDISTEPSLIDKFLKYKRAISAIQQLLILNHVDITGGDLGRGEVPGVPRLLAAQLQQGQVHDPSSLKVHPVFSGYLTIDNYWRHYEIVFQAALCAERRG